MEGRTPSTAAADPPAGTGQRVAEQPGAGTETPAAQLPGSAPIPGLRPAGQRDPLLGRDGEQFTREEWKQRLATKHLSEAYPQQFGKQQYLGTVSRLGLMESTGPLLAEDPVRLGRFRVITVVATTVIVGVVFAQMPATDHKGRPTIFASVRLRLPSPSRRQPRLTSSAAQVQNRVGRTIDRVLGLNSVRPRPSPRAPPLLPSTCPAPAR